MMNSTQELNRPMSAQDKIPQLGIWGILGMFGWPALWYTLLTYGVRRLCFPGDSPIPTWFQLLVIFLGPGAEMAAGLTLLRREGYRLSLASLRSRLRLRWPKSLIAWIVAGVLLIAGMSLSMMMGAVNVRLAGVPGFHPPAWWPAGSNPIVEVNGAADVFPDIDLVGNYAFALLYLTTGLVFNIFGEEIYYRGYLLPRMRAVFGRWDWVANGILFTLKHVYQRWLYPGILVGGLCFALAAGPLSSLPLAMLYHWVGNFLFQMVFLFQAVIGAG